MRKPDYKVSFNDGTDFHNVGAAWVNETGTISIQLDPFVSLPVGPKTKLVLIHKDHKPQTNTNPESQSSGQ